MFVRSANTRGSALPIALILMLAACAPSPATPPLGESVVPTDGGKHTPVPAQAAIPSKAVSAGGAHISVPTSLGSDVEGVAVPAELDRAQPLASGVRFTIHDYPIRRDLPATIEIRRGPPDNEAGSHVVRRFMEMVKFISPGDITATYVPIFAEPSVREQFVAQLRYLGIGMGDGAGPRFVTQFGNAVRPVNNDELVYVFQALHRDNAAWVSMQAPVTLNEAALSAVAPVADPTAFARDYQTNLAASVEALRALPPDAFTPRLDHLDALAKSVRLDWPTPSPDDIATASSRDF